MITYFPVMNRHDSIISTLIPKMKSIERGKGQHITEIQISEGPAIEKLP